MTAITVEEARKRLDEIIETQTPGEELLILKNERVVAKLIVEPKQRRKRQPPGFMKGTVLYMALDFDAPLQEFEEYME